MIKKRGKFDRVRKPCPGFSQQFFGKERGTVKKKQEKRQKKHNEEMGTVRDATNLRRNNKFLFIPTADSRATHPAYSISTME